MKVNYFVIAVSNYFMRMNDFSVAVSSYFMRMNDFVRAVSNYFMRVNDFAVAVSSYFMKMNDFAAAVSDYPFAAITADESPDDVMFGVDRPVGIVRFSILNPMGIFAGWHF